jgi:quercetin dioxygenase-like cupin family protein
MRGLVKKVAIVVLAFGVIAGGAYAVEGELDPTSVPQGFFALGNRATDVFKLKVGSGPEHVYRDGAEVTAQHIRITAGASSGWHSHSGPVFVQVVSGTLTLYERDDPICSPTVITAGNGFVEVGFGNVHDVRNEGRPRSSSTRRTSSRPERRRRGCSSRSRPTRTRPARSPPSRRGRAADGGLRPAVCELAGQPPLIAAMTSTRDCSATGVSIFARSRFT